MRCLRFDDKETRSQRASLDKLAPIRELFEEILLSFRKYYRVSEFVTVDEKLEAFRGRCSFKQYIPSKPNKYGIKIYALTDAKAIYTLNMEIYVGKQPNGPYQVDTGSLALVTRLCEVISKTGRNITCDTFFTSIPLADELLCKHNLTMIGTIRKNKREISKEFVEAKDRKIKSCLFGHRENCTLVSYMPKRNKNVLLISSMHDDSCIDEETGKPEIIMAYNATKGGVDTLDKLCETYNCARGTNRWPMVVFYSLMNAAGINSYVIYTQNNSDAKVSRRKFLETLSYDLMKDHLSRRAVTENLPKLMRERLQQICQLETVKSSSTMKQLPGRCSYCSSTKNRKTRYNCKSCERYFCLEHAVMVCSNCYASISVNE